MCCLLQTLFRAWGEKEGHQHGDVPQPRRFVTDRDGTDARIAYHAPTAASRRSLAAYAALTLHISWMPTLRRRGRRTGALAARMRARAAACGFLPSPLRHSQCRLLHQHASFCYAAAPTRTHTDHYTAHLIAAQTITAAARACNSASGAFGVSAIGMEGVRAAGRLSCYRSLLTCTPAGSHIHRLPEQHPAELYILGYIPAASRLPT